MEVTGMRERFQSTPPARGATDLWRRDLGMDSEFQSTPPARGATIEARDAWEEQKYFNPRPPRGGRRSSTQGLRTELLFQSTPPARGATLSFWQLLSLRGFQSTPPARGATCRCTRLCGCLINFNPRPPRGGRPQSQGASPQERTISIHAPREGGDLNLSTDIVPPVLFQSTPPARGATAPDVWTATRRRNFNPRPPRGGRHGSRCF